MIYDVLILGGGPAGYTAALYCTRAGRKTAIVERMTPGGQMCRTAQIDNYPGFPQGVDGMTLGSAMQEQAERFGAETIWGEIAEVNLRQSPKRVLVDGVEYMAHAVIVALGAEHRRLGVEGEDRLLGRGVGYCAACDGMLFRGKRVAVVGGGDTAVGDALLLAELCESVTLIHRRDSLRAAKILRDAVLRKGNIQVRYNARVREIGGETRVERLLVEGTDGMEEIAVDGVFISIGQEPMTALFADQIACDEGGYVIADESTKTSLDGVFAAGDIRTKPMRQVITAAADGAVASHFAEEYLARILE